MKTAYLLMGSKNDVLDRQLISDKCQLKNLHLRVLLDENTFLIRKMFSFCHIL